MSEQYPTDTDPPSLAGNNGNALPSPRLARGEFELFHSAVHSGLVGKLKPLEALVLLALISHAYYDNKCWPSLPTIAQHLGHSSTSHICTALAKLIRLGLVSKVSGHVPGRRGTTYRLNIPYFNSLENRAIRGRDSSAAIAPKADTESRPRRESNRARNDAQSRPRMAHKQPSEQPLTTISEQGRGEKVSKAEDGEDGEKLAACWEHVDQRTDIEDRGAYVRAMMAGPDTAREIRIRTTGLAKRRNFRKASDAMRMATAQKRELSKPSADAPARQIVREAAEQIGKTETKEERINAQAAQKARDLQFLTAPSTTETSESASGNEFWRVRQAAYAGRSTSPARPAENGGSIAAALPAENAA